MLNRPLSHGAALISWCVLFTAVLVATPGTVSAQFPFRATLEATSGAPVLTPSTKIGAKYRITVEGTYSQWPQFTDCHGVDAAWVYDVPQEEVDAGRWPPQQILGIPFVEIPHWVGDSTEWVFPPPGLGLPPQVIISFRKLLGFRVDHEPLPSQQLDRTLHRYQIEKAGTGEAIRFQILDSTYNLSMGGVVPRYEDNCGALTVTVEEILDEDINICDVEKIVVNGRVVGLKVDASILIADTTSVDGRTNILKDADQLGIVVNGRFICPDSIVCAPRDSMSSVATALVVDRSGSMESQIMYEGRIATRIEAMKRALRGFVDGMAPQDTACMIEFSDDIVETLDWTSDKQQLGAAIDGLQTKGYTAFYEALNRGLQKTRLFQHPERVLIGMTDGVDNRSVITSGQLINDIRQSNIPLYLVALGLSVFTADEAAALDTMQMLVDAAPRGKLFRVENGDQLDSLYRRLSVEIAEDECCTIYFTLPECDPSQDSQRVQIVYVMNDTIQSRTVYYDCDPVVTGIHIEQGDAQRYATVMPSPLPASDVVEFVVSSAIDGAITVDLFDLQGVRVLTQTTANGHAGLNRLQLSTQALASGTYIGRITTPRGSTSVKVIIAH